MTFKKHNTTHAQKLCPYLPFGNNIGKKTTHILNNTTFQAQSIFRRWAQDLFF